MIYHNGNRYEFILPLAPLPTAMMGPVGMIGAMSIYYVSLFFLFIIFFSFGRLVVCCMVCCALCVLARARSSINFRGLLLDLWWCAVVLVGRRARALVFVAAAAAHSVAVIFSFANRYIFCFCLISFHFISLDTRRVALIFGWRFAVII